MKRNFIKLVKDVKDDKPVFDTYLTPTFIPFRKMYDAADVQDEIENNKSLTEKQQMDIMLDMVVDIYNKQFTRDQLLDGLHSPDAGQELMSQIEWVAQGKMDEERKKELAKMV
ncbi:hypothetical protein BFS35_012110 [Macrococcoides goetzii]|uniref:Phage protein n=1 Tax=Macrococcoides goetzii TaxID=1891097 RepID=A0A2G5NV74_9STAP|nr:hypothetical protein [Macrococcus goetzii]RAI79297.1 hypothetical protein BFS35_012110 [Macrococcus goetzii]